MNGSAGAFFLGGMMPSGPEAPGARVGRALAATCAASAASRFGGVLFVGGVSGNVSRLSQAAS
jgi:hypothetical protein